METNLARIGLADEEMVAIKDWRKALKSQPTFRVVKRTMMRRQIQLLCLGSIVGLLYFIYVYSPPFSSETSQTKIQPTPKTLTGYNTTYPITKPVITKNVFTYKIGIIADLDTNSKSSIDKNLWFSYLKTGFLSYYPNRMQKIVIAWDDKEAMKLTGNYASKGRGMELSELVTFDGRLLTVDDRTGIVFEIAGNKVLPWVLLTDGDGHTDKGFKSEWATVKRETLHIGSMGKEWTTSTGEFVNHNPQFIKAITRKGNVEHIDWVDQYKRIREQLNIYWPGYMIHEAVAWSDFYQEWFFLPRRCSTSSYDESLDERRGCSVIISANEDFNLFRTVEIRNSKSTRGFSSFKFLPATNDKIIVALRTEELNGKTSTYITVFTIYGDVYLADTHIADVKYEGFEFI